jgi:tetratricopeptide (TPR) repeat protein
VPVAVEPVPVLPEVPVAVEPVPVLPEVPVAVEPVPVLPEAPVAVEPTPIFAAQPPEDPTGRLAMARAAMQAGSWSEALSLYGALVNSSDLLDVVINDLEEGIKKHPDDYAGYQLAGDAYMKDGRLPSALRAYRTALAKLNQ